MREARRHRALRAILEIREVEQVQARGALADAERAERDARDAAARADDAVAKASRAWEDHLGQGNFSPELAQALAGQLRVQAGESQTAARRAAAAASLRDECETGWRKSDMRQRQAEQSLAVSRRALLHEREERVLEAVADRTSFAWSRR